MYSSLSFGSSVLTSNSLNPTMAFKGVRISWLMLDRNIDFNRSDISAASFARFHSLATRVRSETSSYFNTTPRICPSFFIS